MSHTATRNMRQLENRFRAQARATRERRLLTLCYSEEIRENAVLGIQIQGIRYPRLPRR